MKTSPLQTPAVPLEQPGSGDQLHHYLPLSDELFHCGFYVTSCGTTMIPPGAPYPPVKHPTLYHFDWHLGRILPEFSLILITAGQGIFESKATGMVPLKSGMAALLFPGVWHRYRPELKTGWTERWMHFNGQFTHLLLNQKIISPELAILRPRRWKELEMALHRQLAYIHEARSSNSVLISLQGLSILTLALSELAPLSASKNRTRAREKTDPLLSAAMDYIWTRSHQVLSVPKVAKAVGVTRRTLERHMMSERRHSVLDEIIQCRFWRAERLLRETSLPLKTVVDLAGFGSPENMRQVFLTRVKCSPLDYREKFKGGLQGEATEEGSPL